MHYWQFDVINLIRSNGRNYPVYAFTGGFRKNYVCSFICSLEKICSLTQVQYFPTLLKFCEFIPNFNTKLRHEGLTTR
jgi:hypothetical protein